MIVHLALTFAKSEPETGMMDLASDGVQLVSVVPLLLGLTWRDIPELILVV